MESMVDEESSLEDDDDDDVPKNYNIDRLLNLKYQRCRDFFSEAFLTTNNIAPDWCAAKISGRDFLEKFLLQNRYRENIPSSCDYTVYNIQKVSSKR